MKGLTTYCTGLRVACWNEQGQACMLLEGTGQQFLRTPILDIPGGVRNITPMKPHLPNALLVTANDGKAYEVNLTGSGEHTDANPFGYLAPIRTERFECDFKAAEQRLHAVAAAKRTAQLQAEQSAQLRAEQQREAAEAAIASAKAELAERKKSTTKIQAEIDELNAKAGDQRGFTLS
jgi:hypothetical protein